MLFSHPLDFTPVCTTELASAAKNFIEFEKRNVKLLALACSPLESHKLWIEDIKTFGGLEKSTEFPYPLIDDGDRNIAVMLGMIHPQDKTNPALPISVRHVRNK
jgi:1-Cys peroxiredoxin 6